MSQLPYALQHLGRPLENGGCRFGEIANFGGVAIDHETPASRHFPGNTLISILCRGREIIPRKMLIQVA